MDLNLVINMEICIKLLKRLLSLNIKTKFMNPPDIIIPPYITKLAISKVEFSYDKDDAITCWIYTNIREEYPVLVTTLDYETTKIKYNELIVNCWVLHNNDFTTLDICKMEAYIGAYKKLVKLLEDVSTLPKYEKQWRQLLLRAESPTNHIEFQEELDNVEELFNQCYHLKNDNTKFAQFTQYMFNKHYGIINEKD
jgi:hypothetical protein